MKGYKAFESDLTCRGFQYEIGKTYEHDGEIELCKSGFHFCKSIAECYKFYSTRESTRICEVEAIGDIKTNDGSKYVTNKITIIAEVTEDWKRKGNSNASNLGYCNSGNHNLGDFNSGNYNSGNHNSGKFNLSFSNSGNYNLGYCNSGNRNLGDTNSGDWNAGNWNSGNWNSGNWNTGNWNSGLGNTGNWNATDWSSGCFCTEEPEALLFDKPSGMTMSQFITSFAYEILISMPTKHVFTEWDDNTNSLKIKNYEADRQKWYDELSDDNKDIIKAIPNFDADKFYKCTGIRAEKKLQEDQK